MTVIVRELVEIYADKSCMASGVVSRAMSITEIYQKNRYLIKKFQKALENFKRIW